MRRVDGYGRVDRGAPLAFTFDGAALSGLRGDTLASALLANGVDVVGTSIHRGRPRGISAAGAEEPNGLVQVESGGGSEPMLRATEVELTDGLVARGLPGRGRARAGATPAVYDRRYEHCDVLVVGGGPAGLAAAYAASATGARVILAESGPELWPRAPGDRGPVRHAGERLAIAAETRVLLRTTAVGAYDAGYVVLAERRTDHLGGDPPPGVSRERLWHVRARRIVLASGAHERPVAFAGNDLPGVMLAGAAREYLERFGVLAGSRAVLMTTNDAGHAAAAALAAAGLEIAAVADPRPGARAVLGDAEQLAGAVVCAAEGERRVTGAVVREAGGAERTIACDLLLVAGGWSPVVHLLSQAQGTVRWDARVGGFVPDAAPEGWHVAGAVTGTYGHDACLAEGGRRGQGRRSRGRVRRTGRRAAARDPPQRAGPPRSCGRSRRRPAGARTTASSTSSATRRSPTSAAPWPPGCARPSTSSASPRSARRTTRAVRPASSRWASWPSCSSCRSTRSGRRRSARRSRRSASRCSRGRTAARSPTPSAPRRSTRGTSPTTRCSRTSASGSGRGSTRATARTWTPPSCASARRRAARSR